MPINAGYEYFDVEKKYLAAGSDSERIYWLEELIKVAPKHKSAENLLKQLRTRLKKLKENSEKSKKGGGKKGIRKEGYQCILVGLTNSGKSSLLGKLTNAKAKISGVDFTTKQPELGSMEFQGVKAQIVDLPSIGSEYFDFGLINTADCVLEVVEKIEDLEKIKEVMGLAQGDKIIVVNKIDLLDNNGKRKLEARCKSKRLDFVLVSSVSGEGIDDLKAKILDKMGVVRVYTKEPGKEKAKDPVVLQEGSTVKDVAEKILKGFSKRIKEIRLTGPSGKFVNQRVGMNHKVKDGDVVEFKEK